MSTQTVKTASPDRPDQRAETQRPLSDKERAAARAAELLDSGSLDMDSTDKFAIDLDSIPEAWTYEWKRHSTFNKEDPGYQVELKRMGWDAVPASRHPEMMPAGYKGVTIEREGMILMERPQIITDRARAQDRRAALELVQVGEKNLQDASPGQFERSGPDGSLVKIKKTMEPMEIPEE